MIRVIEAIDPTPEVDLRTIKLPVLKLAVWIGQLRKSAILFEFQEVLRIVNEIGDYANARVMEQIEEEMDRRTKS